jgi:hypothetical protein
VLLEKPHHIPLTGVPNWPADTETPTHYYASGARK